MPLCKILYFDPIPPRKSMTLTISGPPDKLTPLRDKLIKKIEEYNLVKYLDYNINNE